MAFRFHAGLVLVVLFLTLCAQKSYTLDAWVPEEEKVLIVGVPEELQPTLFDFLKKTQVTYRFDEQKRTFYVKEDPIAILEKAKTFDELRLLAQRGLWERELEKKFRQRWPAVVEPRVCVSLPSYFPGKMEDAEPIAFILARGLSKEDIQEAREMVARAVPGLPIGNVSIIGTSWRPWRGYQNEPKHENQVALRSEQIEP